MGIHGSFPKLGYLFGGPHNKDYSMLGPILGSLYFGKLPHVYYAHMCIHIYIYIYIYM